MAAATLLLPGRSAFAGQRLAAPLSRVLGRADSMSSGESGDRAQLLRHFELLPRGWPVAALSRQADAGDATGAAWLRADPAWVRPDINGVRLFGHGQGLQLTEADVDALLPALRPLFGDNGFLIDAPNPSRWYVQLPLQVRLPVFSDPEDALGADLFEHLVDAGAGSAEARRWRALLSEVQVVLHNHPWNARRVAAGRPPVNSLWFWGGGVLPDHVCSRPAQVQSDDALLRGMAMMAGLVITGTAQSFAADTIDQDALMDLRGFHDLDQIIQGWLQPAAAALAAGKIDRLHLDFADGTSLALSRNQRWRLWRRPLQQLAPTMPRQSPG